MLWKASVGQLGLPYSCLFLLQSCLDEKAGHNFRRFQCSNKSLSFIGEEIGGWEYHPEDDGKSGIYNFMQIRF